MAKDAQGYPTSVAQRTGYLVELMANAAGIALDTEPLARVVAHAPTTELDPHGPARGSRDARWRLDINTSVEPD